MSTQKATLSVLLGLTLSSCLDFSAGLEACRDAGRCVEKVSGAGGGGGSFDSEPGPTASTVMASPTTLRADGKSAATVRVTVRNQAGQPLMGQIVTVVHQGLATAEPKLNTTGTDGVATFALTSPEATTGVVHATVNPGASQVTLADAPTVTFILYHTLGGRLMNLAGSGLVLTADGEPELRVDAGAETFAFVEPLPPGAGYSVRVKTPPSAQHCTVDGGTGIIGDADVSSVEIACVSAWAQVAAGSAHVVGLKTDGTVWTWGDNLHGGLGHGIDGGFSPSPGQIASGFAAVASGAYHSMAITPDGGLWVWGYNRYGQLGTGSISDELAPVSIGDGYKAVALGWVFSVFLKQTGEALAAGYNNTGQLGNGTTSMTTLPTSFWPDFDSISSGSLHGLGLQSDGGLWAWGFNTSGGTGLGTDAGFEVLLPAQVPGAYAHVSAGGFFTLALRADGSLWGWGGNDQGQLGDPNDGGSRFEPEPLGGTYSRVAAGSTHGLGLKADGTLWAWGSCDLGQLGDGCDAGVKGPVLVGGDFVSMAAGTQSSLGIKRDGTLWAWGSNQDGRLGIGLDGGIFPLPVLVR